jgi:hypothetical protein
MFHIHCGAPGFLGPVLIDFGRKGDLTAMLKTGKMSLEITNSDINWVSMLPKGFKAPESCPIGPGWPVQTKTIGGVERLARDGILYFNLHTKQHTYFGEMRGQLYLVP